MSPSDTAPDGRFWLTPAHLPFVLDRAAERLGVIRLSEAQYREASFLDDRILSVSGPPFWTPWAAAQGVARTLAPGCDFIFHVGHVGSTLLSRLLGLSDQVFSVREPKILRTVALTDDVDERERRLAVLLPMLARVWRAPQRSLVKATSFVGEIAPQIMDHAQGARAILMFAPPQAYIAGIFAGEASRREMNRLAESRLARLDRRVGAGWPLDALGEGERAAMSWACELVALAEVASHAKAKVLWVDFDRFLDAPRDGLARVLRHLHGVAPPAVIDAMLSSPERLRYAKAQEYAYDAQLRRAVIGQAAEAFRQPIARGLAWLDRLGNTWPPFAAAARAAAAGSRL